MTDKPTDAEVENAIDQICDALDTNPRAVLDALDAARTPITSGGGGAELAATRIQLWWMTQKHEPMHRNDALDLARAALTAKLNSELPAKPSPPFKLELTDEPQANSEALVEALRNLVMLARTSGGVAGPDAYLMDACEKAEALLAERGERRG